MIPPPAPVPPQQGRDSKATMIKNPMLQLRVMSAAFVTAAPTNFVTRRRVAQGVG